MSSAASSSSAATSQFKAGAILTGAHSVHGVQLNVLSSAIQKAIRRSDPEAALWSVIEWLRFHEWTHQQAKGVLSNLKNRILEIIAFEDVVAFAQPWLIGRIIGAFGMWERDKIETGRYVWYAVQLLCAARKCRVGSDIRAYFSPHGWEPTVELDDAKQAEEFLAGKQRAFTAWKQQLDDRSEDSFTSLFELLQTGKFSLQAATPEPAPNSARHQRLSQDLNRRRKQQTTLVRQMWAELLRRLAQQCPSFVNIASISEGWFFEHGTRKERFLYPVHATLALLHADRVETAAPPGFPLLPLLKEGEWMVLVKEQIQSSVPVFPSYVLDMHTQIGRQAQRGRFEFVFEGSRVIPEDVKFLNPVYRSVYVARKLAEAHAAEKASSSSRKKRSVATESVDSPPTAAAAADVPVPARKKGKRGRRDIALHVDGTIAQSLLDELRARGWIGQRVTSKWKQVVLMDEQFVYKGPYTLDKGDTRYRMALAYERYTVCRKLAVQVPQCTWLLNEINDNEMWLRMEQVSRVPMAHWTGTDLEEQCNGEVSRVVDRSSLEVENCKHLTYDEWYAYPTLAIRTLIMLAVRYILDPPIGDTGLHAILCRTSDMALYMIDYEEERAIDDAEVEEACFGDDDPLWVLPFMPTTRMSSDDRRMFEDMTGIGTASVSPDLISRWQEIKTRLATCESHQYSATRVSQIDRLMC